MKSEKKILSAFILNLSFALFEFFGGIFTGSITVISDAVHDMGDAASIGISYFLEKKSKKEPDERYTYGYSRYSVLGGFIMTVILLSGSAVMIYNAVNRIITPVRINYNGMIILSVIGVCVNFCAAIFTEHGESLNQKAVNLHMIEDVLGWGIVLVGAIVMRFTDFSLIDPLMSICVSVFIITGAVRNLKEIADLFLEKAPHGISIAEIKQSIGEIEGIIDVHHIHVRSIDGHTGVATMHIVTDSDTHKIKDAARKKMREFGIEHLTVETETGSEHCHEIQCNAEFHCESPHHHHHSH